MTTSGRRIAIRAGALLIGGELLSGKIADQNLLPLAETLRALGITLWRAVLVGDVPSEIADELTRLRASADVIFTSGGVGPTHDDVTVSAVAAALGVAVVEEPRLVALLESVYGDGLSDTHRLMARVPEGSELFFGSDMRWPAIVCQGIWIFPGVPELFRMKLALIREHLTGPTQIFSTEVLTRSEEVELKSQLDRIVESYPDVAIGSYPKWFDPRFKTRITFDGADEGRVFRAAAALRELLGESVVTLD